MTRRDLACLAYRSTLVSLIVAGSAFLVITPAGLVQDRQAMSATLREVSAGVAWSGIPSPENPDVFILKIQIADTYRKENPDFAVSVRLEWEEAGNDFDLLVSKEGKRIDDSSQGQTVSEDVWLAQPENGIYHIFTHAANSESRGSYTGRVRLLHAFPEPARRRAQYVQDPDGPAGPELFQFVSKDLAVEAPVHQKGRSGIEIDAYGQTYVYLDLDGAAGAGQGKPIVDRNGTLMNVVTGASGNELYLSTCTNPCDRSSLRRIFRGSSGARLNNPYPTIAIDRVGGLHVAFSTGADILLMSSADGGNTWKDPVAVNDPTNNDASMGHDPWIFAGDSGRVGIVWIVPNGNVYYAFTSDAYRPLPAFSYVVAGTVPNTQSLPTGAVDPFGNPNIVIGSTTLLRQICGESFFFGPFIAVVGGLRTESGMKQVSFNVRQNAGGSLAYRDEQRGVLLHSIRLTSSKYQDAQIALTGSGRLSDGTPVTFTALTSDPSGANPEFSISMSNGYFAAGPLQVTPALEMKVQTVTREISHIERPARNLAQP
ncbi:MAG: exo-alpha-sialidase [Acidobacteria bacterium]|nr:exo-alpha-sialidase [Acidobacteriota bacterium]